VTPNIDDETEKRLIQSAEYGFPYHYLASFDVLKKSFSSYRRLGFALPYSVTARLIYEVLTELAPERWLDVGCGDGALISGLDKLVPNVTALGIDYDPRSVSLARLLNPSIDFTTADITDRNQVSGRFDFVTLVEVFEHIEPAKAKDFLRCLGGLVSQSGTLVVTVPHINQRMPKKHFRHFTCQQISDLLMDALPDFQIVAICGFNKKTILERVIKGLLQTKRIFVEIPLINRVRFRQQLRAIPVSEKSCQQIFVRLQRKG